MFHVKQPAKPAEIEAICTLYGFRSSTYRSSSGTYITRVKDGMTFWPHPAWSAEDWIAALRSY